jgi:hypothetical protein
MSDPKFCDGLVALHNLAVALDLSRELPGGEHEQVLREIQALANSLCPMVGRHLYDQELDEEYRAAIAKARP